MPENTNPPELNESPQTIADNYSKEYPELSAKPADNKMLIIAGVSVVVTLLLLIGFGVFLFLNPAIASVLRDIVIVFFGLAIVVIITLLMILVGITVYIGLKLNDLIKLLSTEIKPVLINLQQTMSEVRGTASFISDNAVQPVIETASAVSATRTILRSLFKR